MTYYEIFVLFALGFGATLWWLITTGYPEYQVDKLRERLFSIRCALFEVAKKYDLFDAPVYHLTRQTMNGAIRFAHKPSILGYIVWVVMYKPSNFNHAATAYATALREGLRELRPEVRMHFRIAHTRMHEEYFNFLLKSSWLIGPLSLVIAAILRSVNALRFSRDKMLSIRMSRRQLRRLDAAVNQIGEESARQPKQREALAA
jgi:hypothetical protein